jgi:hypothetical protein
MMLSFMLTEGVTWKLQGATGQIYRGHIYSVSIIKFRTCRFYLIGVDVVVGHNLGDRDPSRTLLSVVGYNTGEIHLVKGGTPSSSVNSTEWAHTRERLLEPVSMSKDNKRLW